MIRGALPLKTTVPLLCVKVPLLRKFPPIEQVPDVLVNRLVLVKSPIMLRVAEEPVKVPLFDKEPESERDPVPLLNVPALMVKAPNDLAVTVEKVRVPLPIFVKSKPPPLNVVFDKVIFPVVEIVEAFAIVTTPL